MAVGIACSRGVSMGSASCFVLGRVGMLGPTVCDVSKAWTVLENTTGDVLFILHSSQI